MCSSFIKRHKRLQEYIRPSTKLLRVANGTVIHSEGTWSGPISIGSVSITTEFEIFPSGGAWTFLLGKPLLKELDAIQAYRPDVVIIQHSGNAQVLYNQCTKAHLANDTSDQADMGNTPSGMQSAGPDKNNAADKDKKDQKKKWEPKDRLNSSIPSSQSPEEEHETQPEMANLFNVEPDDVFTRHKEPGPFYPKRVERILKEVHIGPDLTEAERLEVDALIAEFADIFALSIGEVNPVDGAEHKLNIDPNIRFKLKVHQKRLSPPQTRYLHAKIDEMLEADIIEPIHPRDVKFVAPTVLAQKAHTGKGLSQDELKYTVNQQCISAGLPTAFDLPDNFTPPPLKQHSGDTSWRICQNFGGINKYTEVAPMPQGDIRAKQQRLSGHRWVSTLDFASGFYAVTIAPES